MIVGEDGPEIRLYNLFRDRLPKPMMGRQGILDYFTKGRGSLKLRAKAATEKAAKIAKPLSLPKSLSGEQSASHRSSRWAGETKRRSRVFPKFATKVIATACASCLSSNAASRLKYP